MKQNNKNNSNSVIEWIDYRLPIISLLKHYAVDYPTFLKNLNYWWNFGSLAGFFLLVQIITGIMLSMHYTAHVDHAFSSIEHIMRNVNHGWLIRYVHMNGASFFFIVVYIHIFRGLYYGSYKADRELLWWLGIIILFINDGNSIYGICITMGTDVFLGSNLDSYN